MLERALVLIAACLLGGCANLSYYAQAVGGHLQVMGAARPIPDVLADPETPAETRRALESLPAMRDFASRELGLPDNGSYRRFADLGRPYVVWNVFAAQEFSVELERSCLLFVGCVTYRGFYAREAAEAHAARLRERGLETFVAGIPAYSTLGFFDDPVLNTFLRFGELETARTLFHELAHQKIYIRDDSVFNESFASAVETEGLRRWLMRQGKPELMERFERGQALRQSFREAVVEIRQQLQTLYRTDLPDAEKRNRKNALLADFRAKWAQGKGFDSFFAQPTNNATLGSVGLYTALLPAFLRLLEKNHGDLPGFYQQVKNIGRLDCSARRQALSVAAGDCPPEATR